MLDASALFFVQKTDDVMQNIYGMLEMRDFCCFFVVEKSKATW